MIPRAHNLDETHQGRGLVVPAWVRWLPALALLGLLAAVLSNQRYGPSELTVCTHILDVLGNTDVKVCEATMTERRDQLGPFGYQRYANCVLDTETFSELAACRRD